MVIVLVNTPEEQSKLFRKLNKLSTAAAAENILLALHALGYGGIWRTGSFAF